MKKQHKKKAKRTNNKKILILWFSLGLALLAGIAAIFYYTTKNEPKFDSEYVKHYEPAFVKNGQLVFIKKDKNEPIKTIDIEVADNEAKRMQGLMWRRSMSDGTGMLFIFEDEKPLSFWMKNTYISLDIIYINKAMDIVSIRDNTTPFSEIPVPSDNPAQYAVEVMAGFCNNYNIDTGDKVKFEIITPHSN
jgi:uncharacterized membrane protein (UPF0127 family)